LTAAFPHPLLPKRRIFVIINSNMSDIDEFRDKLKAALDARQEWIERSEMPKLKDEFRSFHVGVSTLYGLFVKKGFIAEDPYKTDTKTNDLHVPDCGALNEANKRDQLGQRLSQLDNELDHLVNFYQFNTDSFTQEKIKIMLGLIRYVDWGRLSPDAGPVTQAVSDVVANIRHASSDPVSSTLLNESLSKLDRSAGVITNYMKLLSEFNREVYKYEIRANGTAGLSASEANLQTIKKKMAAARPGYPFFQKIVEEVIKEDYSAQAEALHEKILKRLAVADSKTKVAKVAVNYRAILTEGINIIGSAGTMLTEILAKLEVNQNLMENRKGFLDKIKKFFSQIMSKENKPVFYELEYVDPAKNAPVKEQMNYFHFIAEIEKKSKILIAIMARGSAEKKLAAMEENQLMEILQRNIKDVSSFHKTLSGIDEFFKKNVDKADRSYVRGIKPELSALKNAVSKANQKFYDYNALKEEAEQFKKLGIDIEA
jgi:hypothetical protein